MTPARFERSAANATPAITALAISKRPPNADAALDSGLNTRHAKNTARFTITPTTAAVIVVSGAVSFTSPRVRSTRGPPARMKRNDGRNVKKVATHAPATPAAKIDPAPSAWRDQ